MEKDKNRLCPASPLPGTDKPPGVNLHISFISMPHGVRSEALREYSAATFPFQAYSAEPSGKLKCDQHLLAVQPAPGKPATGQRMFISNPISVDKILPANSHYST